MSEKLNIHSETNKDAELLEQAGNERREALTEHLEHEQQSPEQAQHEQDVARHEALELATSQESEQEPEQAPVSEKPRATKPTKHELDANFKQTMTHIRKDMKPASRAFSKVIHNPVVEKVSAVAGSTVARPNLILAGALGTIILCSIIYFVAKTYAYPLSGSEAIATFIIGWVIGAIIEYARVGFLNRQTR